MKAARVTLVNAHPDEGSISMEIYRRNLMGAYRPGEDRYELDSLPRDDRLPRRAGRLRVAWSRYLAYPAQLRRTLDAELVHLLDHSSAHLLDACPAGVRTVVTLHDLIPLRFPGGLSEAQVARFRRTAERLRGVDAVVAVSEYTRDEAAELLGLDRERVTVIPNGVTVESSEDGAGKAPDFVRRMRGAENRTIVLSVGSTLERKNLQLLSPALARFQELSGRPVGLLRVGAPLPEEIRTTVVAALGEEGLLEAGTLETPDLHGAYREADVVFFPSLYEGFGLPVLEAFAFGKPVACSDRSSLPEVGGELAVYFDPEDAEAAARALHRSLSEDTEEARALRLARAAEFTWRRNLEALYEVYDRVLA